MSEANSYRTILRSSSIVGGASVINIAVGLVRNKAAAVLLGPAGVGMIGLLLNLMQAAATLAGLGLGQVGTRQIAKAAASGEVHDLARARRALFWGTLFLATVGAVVFFLMRDILAVRVLRNPPRSSTIAWLSIGVFLIVSSSSQQALLTGLRRIGDLARVQIGSALLSVLLGVAAIVRWRESGIALFIIALPLATFIMGHRYVRKLNRIRSEPTPIAELTGEWRAMARLGIPFLISGLITVLGNLLLRSIVQREIGPEALGQFQASWSISMTYIGFILSAMATDYYPRLTGQIAEPATAVQIVNQQTEVALLLAGPVLIGMLGAAPWIIHLLYSSQFAVAAEIFRWQVLGDILKIAGWPLGYVLLAAGAGRTFMVTEATAMFIFVSVVAFLLPHFGIVAAGWGFVAMYAVYLPLTFWLARSRIPMMWTRTVKLHLSALIAIALILEAITYRSETAAAAIGLMAAACLALVAAVRLSRMAQLASSPATYLSAYRRLIGRTGRDDV